MQRLWPHSMRASPVRGLEDVEANRRLPKQLRWVLVQLRANARLIGRYGTPPARLPWPVPWPLSSQGLGASAVRYPTSSSNLTKKKVRVERASHTGVRGLDVAIVASLTGVRA